MKHRSTNISRTARKFMLGRKHALTHGHCSRTYMSGAYHSYKSAKQRCNWPKAINYIHYGERGIKFLFTSFEKFYAELGDRPKGMTLDRIDNNGNYEPGNIKWLTPKNQRLNQRQVREI